MAQTSRHRSCLVRPALATDYTTFARLFAELATDDPVIENDRFNREIVPTMLIAEDENGAPLGYVYVQPMKHTACVRHLVTAPNARRRGVATALLQEVAERMTHEGCTDWYLNVKPTNHAAIVLYEQMGFRHAFASRALRIDWTAVEAAAMTSEPNVKARVPASHDDALVEQTMGLEVGTFASARRTPERVLLMLETASREVVGATVFAPHFPGAYPFRVARPALACRLLRAIHPYARPRDMFIHVVVENQPEVADALLRAGATLRLDFIRMAGSLSAQVREASHRSHGETRW
jgi:ribosomal protein S18 acetylase RimI-like enzyme